MTVDFKWQPISDSPGPFEVGLLRLWHEGRTYTVPCALLPTGRFMLADPTVHYTAEGVLQKLLESEPA